MYVLFSHSRLCYNEEIGDVAFVTSPFSCDILFQDMEKLRNQLDRKEENVHTEKVIHIFLSDEDGISFS